MSARGATGGEARQFAGFVVTGGIAAGVNIAARWLLSLALPYALAVTLAYGVGMVTAFLLARGFVFGRGRRGAFARFALVNAASLAVVLGVSLGLAALLPRWGWSWHAHDVAHVVGVASPILLSFYAHKHFSFAGAGA